MKKLLIGLILLLSLPAYSSNTFVCPISAMVGSYRVTNISCVANDGTVCDPFGHLSFVPKSAIVTFTSENFYSVDIWLTGCDSKLIERGCPSRGASFNPKHSDLRGMICVKSGSGDELHQELGLDQRETTYGTTVGELFNLVQHGSSFSLIHDNGYEKVTYELIRR